MEVRSPGGVVPRWAALLLGGIAIALVPWTLYLSYTLPARHVTNHWGFAWSGFDVGLAASLVLTAIGIARNAPWLEAAASVSTVLLLTDAWFDIVLSNGAGERLEAIALACIAEIPLALFCLWIALNAERAVQALSSSGARRPARSGADGARAAPPAAPDRPSRRG